MIRSDPARPGRERRVPWLAAGVLVVLLACDLPARAEEFRPLSWRALANSQPTEFALDLQFPRPIEIPHFDSSVAPGAEAEPTPAPRTFWIVAASIGTVAGSAYNSFGDGPNVPFHVAHEGYFGRNTYAGGSDKTLHFVSYNAVARLLSGLYEDLRMTPDNARLLGFAVSTFAGLVTEIGDGTTRYGFSYEDFLFDLAGAATALLTAHYGLDDLVGFRAGLVPRPIPPCCVYAGFGYDYSELISTADLKIAGLSRRLHWNPGPARFLYLSATYGVKGYPYSAIEVRERQVGIEIGLHITEILRAAGVPERPWWGQILYFVFDTIRFPYTSIGYQFDLSHRKWRGPGIGDSFPGGP